ncbi:transporter substrate-binding domain-containing protein [Paracoccus pacificus]|uniref:Transporter substrate-binding domain-containing protein n=1 Tax=Paracoccus pacificus TaxID=1463598 RepID=A0ABW4RBB1_9RHOB
MSFHTTLRAALFGISALALGVTAASADQLADVKAAGKLELATDMHYAPFDMLNNGTYEGVTKDLFDEVAKDLGVTPNYMDVPWTAELPGLEAGKFDMVIAPVTITPERLQRYTFTLPIADATVGLVKAASNDAIQKPEDLAGKNVGVQQGTAQEKQLQAYGDKIGGIEIKGYGTADEAYADLAAGRLDAVAGSSPNLAYLVKNRGDVFAPVQPAFGAPTYFAWVLRKDDASKSLADAVNQSILKMHEDGRLKAIQEKWFGAATDLPTEVPQN